MLYTVDNKLLVVDGKLAASASCCCDGTEPVDVCLSTEPAAWKVTLTFAFESCDTRPVGYLNPPALDGTFELTYEAGEFSTGAFYRTFPYPAATPKYGCRSTGGYWSHEGYRVILGCGTGTYSMTARVGTTTSAFAPGWLLSTAGLSGVGAIEAGTTYILTTNINDPLTGWPIPARAVSASLVISPI